VARAIAVIVFATLSAAPARSAPTASSTGLRRAQALVSRAFVARPAPFSLHIEGLSPAQVFDTYLHADVARSWNTSRTKVERLEHRGSAASRGPMTVGAVLRLRLGFLPGLARWPAYRLGIRLAEVDPDTRTIRFEYAHNPFVVGPAAQTIRFREAPGGGTLVTHDTGAIQMRLPFSGGIYNLVHATLLNEIHAGYRRLALMPNATDN
jgi:hypothetical protein